MQTQDLVSFMTRALYLVLWLSLPPIAVAAIVNAVFPVAGLDAGAGADPVLRREADSRVRHADAGGPVDKREIYNFTIAVFDAFHRIH